MSYIDENKKKKSKLKWVILFLIVTFIFGTTMRVIKSNETGKSVTKDVVTKDVAIGVIIDANQFSRITPEELISIMGKTSDIDKWNYTSPNGQVYKATTYTYNNGVCYEFIVIDNSVVRFTFHSEKYNGVNGKSIKFNDTNDLLPMFAIATSNSIKKVADTGVALRYHLVSDKIAEFWVVDIDKANKSFDTVKVTYNLNYF